MMKTRTYYRPSTVSLGKKKRVVRRKTGTRFLLKFLLLLLCGALVAGGWLLINNPFSSSKTSHWKAQKIILSGLNGPLRTQVMATLKPYENKPFSAQDATALHQILHQQYPMLTGLSVKRGWLRPTLTIHAEHRTPLAKFILPNGSVKYIDADRTVYQDAYAPVSSPVPFIELEGEIPEKLSTEIIELVQSTVKLHQELDFAFLRINLTDNTVKMYMPDDCVIDFGTAVGLKQKATQAAKIMAFARGKYPAPFTLNFHFVRSGKVFLTQSSH